MTKEELKEDALTVTENYLFDPITFYMYEYRKDFTPMEVARVFYEATCEYAIKLANEVSEDMEDWAD